MTRISTKAGERHPLMDPQKVAEFFESRARRIDELGTLKAVIYQDKQGDLADRRDRAELQRLMPLLALTGTQRFLDVACGTGRWARRVAPLVGLYHGIDFNSTLLDFARQAVNNAPNCRFDCLKADELSALSLGRQDYDRILCAGIAIYLNDDQLTRMWAGLSEVSAPTCRILLREPVALATRLTLCEQYSEELEHSYNATYRTEQELIELARPALLDGGFSVVDHGEVFSEPQLNNRRETLQRWIVLERRK